MSTVSLARVHVNRILIFGFTHNLEVVSFGLAPNPQGFCYESHGNASAKVLAYFSEALEALNQQEVTILRETIG